MHRALSQFHCRFICLTAIDQPYGLRQGTLVFFGVSLIDAVNLAPDDQRLYDRG
jgi:hypothetical protein